MELTNSLKNNFNKNGFVIVKKLFNKTQIKNILTNIKEIKEKIIFKNKRHFHETKDNKINTLHNIQKFFPKNYTVQISKNKKLIEIVNFLLNGKSKMRNIEFFLKPKKTGMPAPFHQDNFYWNIIGAEGLNVWIACSKCSKKNGGVEYYKESHKLGVIKHKTSFMPGSSQKIPDKIIKKLKYKKITPDLKEGDCIFHHAEIIHGSKPNKSSNDRVGLVIGYKTIKSKYNVKKLKKHEEKLKKNLKKIYK
jgi:phytanoyl-CoA hydroxylase